MREHCHHFSSEKFEKIKKYKLDEKAIPAFQ